MIATLECAFPVRAPSRRIASRRRVVRTTLLATALVLASAGHVVAQGSPAGHMGAMTADRAVRTFLLADRVELDPGKLRGPVTFEGLAWIGGDYRRLFLRAQGEQPTRRLADGRLQADLLLGRLITPFWSAVAGARIDTRPRAEAGSSARVTRGLLAVGFVGLAPFWFELEPTVFVSQDGDVSAEFETSFDLLLTQRLILQPRLELNAAVQRVEEFGVSAGLNDVEVGARFRYEVRRKFAPYVGVSWHRRTGGAAAMARAAGRPVSEGVVVAGVRAWR